MGFSLQGAITGGLSAFSATGNPFAAGLGAIAGGVSGDQRDRATKKAQQGEDRRIGEIRRQFDTTREDFAPFLATGVRSDKALNNILFGDGNAILDNPLIQQLLDNASRRSNRLSSSRGKTGTGAHAIDIFNRSNSVINDRINQLLTTSGRGQNAAGTAGQFGANAASEIGEGRVRQGNLSASRLIGRANSIDNFANELFKDPESNLF